MRAPAFLRWLLPLAAALPSPLAAQATAVALGTKVEAPFTDLRWQRRRLDELGASATTVLYFATIECPMVQRYLPRLDQIARDYMARGVVTVVVNVGPGDSLVDAAGQLVERAPACVFAKDFDLALAIACGVDRTGVAVVLDADRRLVYRGRIDDQHGYGGERQRPSRDDLRAALDDRLAGRAVAVASTEVAGCKITPPAAASDGPAPTWHGAIGALVARHCQECHRPGAVGPFPLLDEAQVHKHAAMLGEVVAEGRMPPWYASSAHGDFVNRRGLSATERDLVRRWLAGGMPSGEASAPRNGMAPAVAEPANANGWRIGAPDLELAMKAPLRLPADGSVPYQYVILPYRFEHDTWVEAIEIKPDNPRVLHHANLARVKFGERFSQDGFITGYVPGGDPMVLDPGTAVRIPAGSALALQAHYVTTGAPEQDRLRVALRFPRQVVQKELQVAIVADFRFEIPAGASAHPVPASRRLRADAIGIGMVAHMHNRGRDMRVTATAPDGSVETLLLVPNYSFDWQQSYRWAAGTKTFARGTKIDALAHFDNSAFNPFNPDPTLAVRFGQQTTDEMMYLFLFWVAQQEQLGLAIDTRTGHVAAR
jgi:mono/diheme cytochrome c family protein